MVRSRFIPVLGIAGALALGACEPTKPTEPPPPTPTDNPPTVVVSGQPTLHTGEEGTYTANANDPDGDQITYDWTPNPITGEGTSSATYVWSEKGTQNISVTVQSKGTTGTPKTATDTKTITIEPTVEIEQISTMDDLYVTRPARFILQGNQTGTWSVSGTGFTLDSLVQAEQTAYTTINAPNISLTATLLGENMAGEPETATKTETYNAEVLPSQVRFVARRYLAQDENVMQLQILDDASNELHNFTFTADTTVALENGSYVVRMSDADDHPLHRVWRNGAINAVRNSGEDLEFVVSGDETVSIETLDREFTWKMLLRGATQYTGPGDMGTVPTPFFEDFTMYITRGGYCVHVGEGTQFEGDFCPLPFSDETWGYVLQMVQELLVLKSDERIGFDPLPDMTVIEVDSTNATEYIDGVTTTDSPIFADQPGLTQHFTYRRPDESSPIRILPSDADRRIFWGSSGINIDAVSQVWTEFITLGYVNELYDNVTLEPYVPICSVQGIFGPVQGCDWYNPTGLVTSQFIDDEWLNLVIFGFAYAKQKYEGEPLRIPGVGSQPWNSTQNKIGVSLDRDSSLTGSELEAHMLAKDAGFDLTFAPLSPESALYRK